MDIVLIHGLWLDASAWDPVLPGLRAAGHHPVAVSLPGQGDGRADATLDDQLDAVLAAVDAASDRVLVVGHSAACTLAWLAADRRPDKVARVALVGGMPSAGGEQYAAFFDLVDGAMPFPGWEPFAGPDSDDLTAEQKRGLEASAHPVPGAVAQGEVTYTDERRRGVPVVLVCPEYSPEEAREWFEAGQMPELEGTELSYVDLDSGHWPMVSAPDELARVLAEMAAR